MILGYCAVMQNDYNSAENYFAMGSDNVPEIYLGNVLLLIKNRNYSKAVEWVKKSLIACQNDKDIFIVWRCHYYYNSNVTFVV